MTMLLNERLKSYRLILASQSPRRRELLEGCALKFELADRYPCEEIYPATLPAEEVPAYLSRLKSEACPTPLAPNEILLTADTVVIGREGVLGKPRDRAQACAMLRSLSGHSHKVLTGVTLRSATRTKTFSSESRVWFRALSDEEICHYIDTCRPYDKAGAYGIQEWIGYIAIERIEGSFYNVMGLPVQRVYTELNNFINKN